MLLLARVPASHEFSSATQFSESVFSDSVTFFETALGRKLHLECKDFHTERPPSQVAGCHCKTRFIEKQVKVTYNFVF